MDDLAHPDAPEPPRAALAGGAGRLHVGLVDGASTALAIEAHNPLKLLVPSPRGPVAWAYAATFGGGLVAGDRIALAVSVDAGATAALGTQSATKIYRAGRDADAVQELGATVGAGATLALVPDPVACFADSRYAQRQELALAADASLLLIDCVTGGRAARGERWACRRYASRNRIHRAGALLLDDATRLDASEGGPLAERFGRFQAFGSVILLGPRFAATAGGLLAALALAPVERGASLLAAASPLADGALLRLAATTTEALEQWLRLHLAPTVAALGGDHWTRRP
jgi:urease accessory protein